MSNLRSLTRELRALIEDGAGVGGMAGGVSIGSAPPGGAPGMPYMGSSFSLPDATLPSGAHSCVGCGASLHGPGPCPSCFPYGPPMRPPGGLANVLLKRSKHKKRKYKARAKK